MKAEQVFYASRTKALLTLLGSIAFVAMGFWLAKKEPLAGWGCVVFFGLGIPVTLIMLLPGVDYLRLDHKGFELKSIGRKHKTKWKDVRLFKITSIRGAKMIAVQYQPQYAGQKALRAAVAAIAGMEGAIPNSYNVSLKELERTLNEWLERFGRDEPNPSIERIS